MSGAEERPVLRIIRGDATPEEIAAVLAVVLARGRSGGTGGERGPVSVWAHGYAMRLPRGGAVRLEPGHDGWRTSYWGR